MRLVVYDAALCFVYIFIFVFVKDVPRNAIDQDLRMIFIPEVFLCLYRAFDADDTPAPLLNGQTNFGGKSVMPNKIKEKYGKSQCGK